MIPIPPSVKIALFVGLLAGMGTAVSEPMRLIDLEQAKMIAIWGRESLCGTFRDCDYFQVHDVVEENDQGWIIRVTTQSRREGGVIWVYRHGDYETMGVDPPRDDHYP